MSFSGPRLLSLPAPIVTPPRKYGLLEASIQLDWHREWARRMCYIQRYRVLKPMVIFSFCPLPTFATAMTPFLHWPAASGGFPRSRPPRYKEARENQRQRLRERRDTTQDNGNTNAAAQQQVERKQKRRNIETKPDTRKIRRLCRVGDKHKPGQEHVLVCLTYDGMLTVPRQREFAWCYSSAMSTSTYQSNLTRQWSFYVKHFSLQSA